MADPDERQAVAAGELISARDPPPTEGNAVVGVANQPRPGFLAALPHAGLNTTAVGLVDPARQESRGRALGRGDKRGSVQGLVNEIDHNLPAGEAPEEGEGSAVEAPQETPTQRKRTHRFAIRRRKQRVCSTMAPNLDDDGQNKDESTGLGLSAKRERKRSKYLLLPYTNDLDGLDLDEKQEDVGAQEVLLLVRGFAKDIFHRRYFPQAAKGYLGRLRSTTFLPENTFANGVVVPECPAEDAFAKATADATIVVSDSSCDCENKQGEGVFKGSGRKNDQYGSGGSSIKGKEVEKTPPPKNHFDRGLLITPAIPIRQLRLEGVISHVKPGVEVDTVTSVQRPMEETVPPTTGLLPMHEGVSSQPTHGNEDTVQDQEPNASLQVMVLKVPNVHAPPPAPTTQLSIPEMRRGVKHMISRLQNGLKPFQENLLGDLQRLLANLDRAQPGPSSSATATS
ncbi:hypothetical protein ACQJBY_030322 [Aegilops geniculata]